MSRYIDLTHAIIRNWHTPAVVKGIRAAMQWLDEHPDQVPGRTITVDELRAGMKSENIAEGEESERLWVKILGNFGITVVPDPEPTNAEKMKWDLRTLPTDCGLVFTQDGAEELGKILSERGWTKAPEDDDE